MPISNELANGLSSGRLRASRQPATAVLIKALLAGVITPVETEDDLRALFPVFQQPEVSIDAAMYIACEFVRQERGGVLVITDENDTEVYGMVVDPETAIDGQQMQAAIRSLVDLVNGVLESLSPQDFGTSLEISRYNIYAMPRFNYQTSHVREISAYGDRLGRIHVAPPVTSAENHSEMAH